jgi:hypothetical protein
VIAGALYLDQHLVAAVVFVLQGLALAFDVGGLAARASAMRRWRELYKGQYSTVMMRVGGAIIVAGGAYWIFTLLR